MCDGPADATRFGPVTVWSPIVIATLRPSAMTSAEFALNTVAGPRPTPLSVTFAGSRALLWRQLSEVLKERG